MRLALVGTEDMLQTLNTGALQFIDEVESFSSETAGQSCAPATPKKTLEEFQTARNPKDPKWAPFEAADG
jgi:hypothetical protein